MAKIPSLLAARTAKLTVIAVVCSMFCMAGLVQTIHAQGSAFTYQGKLTDGGTAANGPYDLIFRLFDAGAGGTQVGGDLIRDDVQVTTGVFTVNLDFGASPFTSATGNFLEISVRPGASTGGFTPLLPLQPITSSPYAVQTLRAESSAVADNALQLGGLDASQYVQDSDSRLTDARMPLAGSSDYVQSNPLAQQPGTNLNIGGNATVGGTLSGNVVNATTQYNIGGQRVLFSDLVSGNFFAGHGTGVVSTGTFNSFVGIGAGQSNTTGYLNSFFGASAGASNTSGAGNSFFGISAGASNTTGFNNTFVGSSAGQNNSTGVNNSFLGLSAGLSNTTGSNNSFLGMGSGATNTTGFNNSFVGYASGSGNTTGVYNSFFGVEAGTSNTTGDRNAFVGSVAGRSNTTGSRNSFFGTDSGFSNTTGSDNSFFGMEAGKDNLAGNQNAFFGNYSGRANTASFNAFFGNSAGFSNTTGLGNSFFGHLAGLSNSTGSSNSFFGKDTGFTNTTGIQNSFFGRAAGGSNSTASNNAFFGFNAGAFNTTGTLNAFFGAQAGEANTTANNNSFFGRSAGKANTLGESNSYFGSFAGTANTTGQLNAFFGALAGLSNTTGQANSFVGALAGSSNTNGASNSFFGLRAGELNTSGNTNSFVGTSAGRQNTTGGSNVFIGASAGTANTAGSSNTLIGTSADVASGSLSHAAAIGAGAVVSTSNTVVLGRAVDTVQVPGNLNVTGNFTGNFAVPAGNITGVLSASQGGTGLNFNGVAGLYLRSNGAGWEASGLQVTDIPGGSANYIQNIPGIGTQAASFNITGGGTANIFSAATQYNVSGSRVLSTPGSLNTFVGHNTGPATTGQANVFLGQNAGINNTVGSTNTFLGRSAGTNNTGGSDNTMVGHNANGGGGLSNTTAIGANALVTRPNSMVLGNNVNVGIGTSAPNAKLQIAGGSVYIQQPNSLIITSPNGSCWFITVNDAGALSTIPVGCP